MRVPDRAGDWSHACFRFPMERPRVHQGTYAHMHGANIQRNWMRQPQLSSTQGTSVNTDASYDRRFRAPASMHAVSPGRGGCQGEASAVVVVATTVVRLYMHAQIIYEGIMHGRIACHAGLGDAGPLFRPRRRGFSPCSLHTLWGPAPVCNSTGLQSRHRKTLGALFKHLPNK